MDTASPNGVQRTFGHCQSNLPHSHCQQSKALRGQDLVAAGASKLIVNIYGMVPFDLVCLADGANCSEETRDALVKLLYPSESVV